MPISPRERLAKVLDGSEVPRAFSARLSVPASDVRLTMAGAGLRRRWERATRSEREPRDRTRQSGCLRCQI